VEPVQAGGRWPTLELCRLFPTLNGVARQLLSSPPHELSTIPEADMRTLSKFFLAMLTALTFVVGFSQAGCYAEEFRGADGRVYRHSRWQNEHVYQHEDGHWYARRNNQWTVVLDAHPE
jgi:hypothetical protein